MAHEISGPEPSAEVQDLRARLAEAEDTLRAIRAGDADALIVEGGHGDEVRLLGAGERAYRQFVEAVGSGTATLSPAGDVVSCDAGLASALRRPIDQVVGTPVWDHIAPEDRERLYAVLLGSDKESGLRKLRLVASDGQLIPVYAATTVLRGADGQPVLCLAFTDLEAVVSAELALAESESHLERAIAEAPVPLLIHAEDGEVVAVNRAWTEASGYSVEEIPTMAEWLRRAGGDHPEEGQAIVAKLYESAGKVAGGEHVIVTAGGQERVWDFSAAPLGTLPDGRRLVISTASDVTQRIRREAYTQLGAEVLEILNQPEGLETSLDGIISAFEKWRGFDAVGIRLQEGDDFPYVAAHGFPEGHMVTENSLIERDAAGDPVRDQDGGVVLECTCGLVLAGRGDPLLTPGGSYWTSDLSPLLDLSAERDPRFHPRNVCVLEGLASVALVPIRDKGRIVGLIHIGDRSKGRFDDDTIQLLEGIAGHIGEALARKHGEQLLERALASTIDVIGRIVEVRDPYTAGHQRRVAELAVAIAREMGMSDDAVAEIRTGALIHDVGKISVPGEILSKPGRLTVSEFAMVQGHAESGYGLIAAANMEGAAAEIAYEHHERCDGSGYPRGLTAEQILPQAKVVAVADVVEAMSSYRPYRPGLGIDAALAEIEQGAGTLYDAEVAAACVRVFRLRGFAFSAA